MNERRFVKEREPAWRELEALLERERVVGLRRLSGAEVRRIAALFRAASTDLASARSLALSDDLLARLNRLCARTHGVVYSGGVPGRTERLRDLLLLEFPREVRRGAKWHLFAAAVFVVGAAATYFVLRAHPDLADRDLPPVFRQRADRVAAQPEGTRQYFEIRSMFTPFLAWGLMVNNILVTLLAFGAGAATVIAGVLIVLFNGVMLGGGFAVFANRGVGDVLLTWTAAHGPVELLAVFIAAGAGMQVGVAWMLPGRRTRAASLMEASRRALRILLGTSVLLVVAGLIEGHISPTSWPAPWKFAIGAATGGASLAWIALAGRPREGDDAPELGSSPGAPVRM